MKIECNLYPNRATKAVTMSFDDGKQADVRLAELFKQYGIKGTFHYNSGNINKDTYVTDDEVREIGKYHEISLHGKTHPFLDKMPLALALDEIRQDRLYLEKLAGKPIRGMSYPYGTFSDELIAGLRSIGIEYSRTIRNTRSFYIPTDFMKWDPTCHHSQELLVLWEKLYNHKKRHMMLFYVWGHSYEFDRDQLWGTMEEFCKRAGGHENIWYATNIEIMDYLKAVNQLRFSADMTMIYNPSALDVWISADEEPVCIHAGKNVCLK